TALGNSTICELFTAPSLLPAWRALAGEVTATAAAQGVSPRGFDGFEPASFSSTATEAAARRSMDAMAALLQHSPKTHSGPWRDIAVHGRRTEITEQLEPVLAAAVTAGVATPALRLLVELVQSVETGARAQSDELIEILSKSAALRTTEQQSQTL